MSAPLASLTEIFGSNVVSGDIFYVTDSTSTNTYKISRDELSKAFTGFTAQNVNGFSIFESAGEYGLSVSGSNGFIGVNNRTPFVSLDIKDNISASNGSGQIRISTINSGRKISFSISDPNVYYQFAKKSNDSKLYLESSIDGGANFTNLMVFNQSGNCALHGTTGSLTQKFLVSGEFIEFQNSGNSIIFDPYNGEIKTSASDEPLLFNYSNLGDIILGSDAIFIDNDSVNPKVGINTNNPTATFTVSGAGQTSKFESNTNISVLGLGNTVDSGFFGVVDDKTFFGPSSGGLSIYNVVYDHSSEGFLGLGTTGPQYKLDINSDALNTVAHFSNTGTAKTCEVIIAANKALGGGDTGPRNSFLTFSRYDSTVDTDKWSIGNIYVDPTFGGSDDFVFIKNGFYGASPNVVAKLSNIGDFDIDGKFTTNSSFCKGQFVEVYSSRLTGTANIYIDPFGVNGSSTMSSGNFNADSPFGVSMYNGKLERVMAFTSDSVTGENVIFQFYAITPAATSVNGFNNIGTTGDTTNVRCSGTFTIYSNQVSQLIFPTFGTFNSGQLLQFRLFKDDYTQLTYPVTLTSSMKYIIV
tara:strand:- start:3862 stop:5610 length:1749 start_codon:yes stop_codon:yes gene_type:complete